MDEVFAPQARSVVPRRAFSLKALVSQDVVARAQPCRSLQDGLQDTGNRGTCRTTHLSPTQGCLLSVVEGPQKPWGTGPARETRAQTGLYPDGCGLRAAAEKARYGLEGEVLDPSWRSLGHSRRQGDIGAS